MNAVVQCLIKGIIKKIRLAQETDLDSILKVVETAFSDKENKVIMNLVQELSRETTSPSIKSLVAVKLIIK